MMTKKPVLAVAICALVVSSLILSAKVTLAQSTIYIYANDTGAATLHGPLYNWYTANGEGYCGHIQPSCSPNKMRWTYTNCGVSNYADWDKGSSTSGKFTEHGVFVPRVNATSTIAPYAIVYNGGSSVYSWNLNQAAYFDDWVKTAAGNAFYEITKTYVYDNTCESSKQLGVDEVEILF